MRDNVQLLAEWLMQRPQDCSGTKAMWAVDWLLEHARMASAVERQHCLHRLYWTQLPEDVRLDACRRQLAALAARLAMRGGMESGAAVAWVIAIAGMTRRDFQLACDKALRDGDRLHVWQWRELRAVGLRDDFMSRRQLERWIELEEPWLFDDRWVFPLHLVDKDVLEKFDLPLSLTPSQEEPDATE